MCDLPPALPTGVVPMRVLIVTVVHVPTDARIYHRQIGALLSAGSRVTYAAPWSDYGIQPPGTVDAVDVPRAAGRRRLRALWAARDVIRRRGADADLLLVHDPELLLAVAGLPGRPPAVWDVHEDVAASLGDRPWVPAGVRPAAARLARVAERLAERHLHLVLAEQGYRDRFARAHPVVPNVPVVPDRVTAEVDDRVVYLGRISRGRGAEELVEVGRRLAPEGTPVELLGWSEPDVRPLLEHAERDGSLRWVGRGFVPNDRALGRVEGALAGLCLLRDEPNYRGSLPTKVVEYLSRGVPVVTTPLPAARQVVERHGCGIVVPFDDPGAAAGAVRQLRHDPGWRAELGRQAHRAALEHYDWRAHAPRFVQLLEGWTDRSARTP
jgi:glycosyltransferase involved in cell wall biosynthesis